jgi:aminocarboxymuconate-semialdehyde decarboxylase
VWRGDAAAGGALSPPLKIDLHTHILPERWPDLEQRYGYGGFVHLEHHGAGRARMMRGQECFREIDDRCWSPGKRLEQCDLHRVHVQVLSTVPVMFSYWARPHDALDLARLLNDHIADVVQQHPQRFVGLGTVPLQDPQLAIGELERCVGELAMPGVQIGTHVNGWNLDQPELFPVLARAAELGAAIFVHPWDMLGRERMTRYALPWLVGMPAETALAISSLILGGVLGRLPNLRIAFAHGGGAFPATIGRIDHAHRARPDLVAQQEPLSPRRYLQRFYVDSLVHDPGMLRYLVGLLGAERIALGSDYPFPLGETVPGELIEGLAELTAAQRQRLLAGTALEFLGLSEDRFGQ